MPSHLNYTRTDHPFILICNHTPIPPHLQLPPSPPPPPYHLFPPLTPPFPALFPLSFNHCIPPCALKVFKWLITATLESKNLSTQFIVQLSSFLSSFALRMEPVMHFFQQTSVREWTAIGEEGN